jgi:hypothetical protein
MGMMRVYVTRLRQKLEFHGIEIETVRGQGWQMDGAARELFPAALEGVTRLPWRSRDARRNHL